MKKYSVAFLGCFLALAMIFSYIESLIPFYFGVPGIKLGLANVLIVSVLYICGPLSAIIISIARVILSGFMFGSLFSIAYSMAGAVLSFICMLIVKRFKFNIYTVSIVGGVTHNLGQILVAMLVVENYNLIFYFPLLMIAGIVTGLIIGVISERVYSLIGPYYRKRIDK